MYNKHHWSKTKQRLTHDLAVAVREAVSKQHLVKETMWPPRNKQQRQVQEVEDTKETRNFVED